MALAFPGSRILFIEDEVDLADPVIRSLREDGFEVKHAINGEAARRLLNDHFDLVILDLVLPDMPGESILTYLRQQPSYPNVLVLTAKTGVDEKIHLFKMGCDDYLTKPYIYEELVERVRALLRRPPRIAHTESRYRDLELDVERFSLSSPDRSVILTPKEAAICRILMDQAEEIVPRKVILQGVWGLKEEPISNYIGVHVFNLRNKFGVLGRADWFQTVRASGFLLSDPGTATPNRVPD